ncbi:MULTISPECIES: hypothetical protein [Flavobacterium]|uniref:Uncharacterized protein n=1 Tax=Flavobacterium aquidurense TaxID=362413 RepID=A0A0N8VLP6_9FLAO|nr:MULTISPECIES: hypothetical protein [Flavobacterium]KQB37108.1 hypothetical protein RC62_2274 [Flavobacterium aquidurense]OMQ13181.1 hypothetical protein BXU01_01490 [[Flexibacter] sp. ATCC 35103]
MDTLRYIISISFIFLFTNCYKTEYRKSDESFQGIYLRQWNSSICPQKIIFEKYVKNSNFKNIIERDSNFEIRGCELTESQFNQRILKPNVSYISQINYDIKLIIDDSIVYKITDIKDGIDTVSVNSGPGTWMIMNNIKSLVVNGQKLDNTKAALNIDIPTKLGKVMKR